MQMSFEHSLGHRQSLVVSQQLRQAIVLLQMGNSQLQEFIENQAEENPFVKMKAPERPLPPQPSRADGDGGDWIAALPDRQTPSLWVHVAEQIGQMNLDEAGIDLAAAFVDALEPSGWLGDSLPALAARTGASLEEACAMLARLQGLEPAGLFARTLAECLRLQAEAQGLITPLFSAVLDHLPMLAAADLPGLARACHCSLADLRPVLRELRSLDPKPGTRFGGEPEPIRPPDLIVSQTPDGWSVELNRSTLPAVVVLRDKADRLTCDAPRADTRVYVNERLSVARWLSRAVEHRNRTVLRIGEEIVRHQAAFFAQGPRHLRPMILKEIAKVANVHESTVSRVVTGILMATPQGCFPLKYFFTAALPARDEACGSAGAVRHRISRLIRAETVARPLSDDQLVQIMKADGIEVARRTVAKYREQLNIPASSIRRRQAVLAGHA